MDKVKVQKTKSDLIQMTNKFCKAHINDEYAGLCQRLIEKMARSRAVPIINGRIEIWAATVVYTVGSINFLFDKNSQPHASMESLFGYFAVSKNAIEQKSRMIREILKIWHLDPEYSTEEMAEKNPFNKISVVNGQIVLND